MLLLDTKNNVVGQRVVYQGNVSSAIVRPAEVLRPAVIEAVPSRHHLPQPPQRQDPTPSPEDAAITREIFAGGQAAGHRASGPRRHRRGPKFGEPEGAGPHGLTLHKSGRPTPSGPHAGGFALPRIILDTKHRKER